MDMVEWQEEVEDHTNMPALATFLQQLLFEGRISLHAPPDVDDAGAAVILRQAYDAYVLSLAGPALTFDAQIALSAGRLVLAASWYFLNPGLLIEEPKKTLSMPSPPAKPEDHLSADLVLRFLPTLHRRAKSLMPNDPLPQALEQMLRQWPLSGVLADIDDPPLTPVDFGEHAGLQFLYAERLAQHERPGWFPAGRGIQYVELVWQQLGKDVSVLPALQEVAEEIRKEGQTA
jgi:hypothetical protein